MTVVDASVWVSRLVPQDVHHAASRDWIEGEVTGGRLLVAPALLLAEVAGAIARRTGQSGLASRAVEGLERLPALRLVSVDVPLARAAAQLAAELSLRGADAVYVAAARHLDLPLVTWDREHRERAGTLVEVRTPDSQ